MCWSTCINSSRCWISGGPVKSKLQFFPSENLPNTITKLWMNGYFPLTSCRCVSVLSNTPISHWTPCGELTSLWKITMFRTWCCSVSGHISCSLGALDFAASDLSPWVGGNTHPHKLDCPRSSLVTCIPNIHWNCEKIMKPSVCPSCVLSLNHPVFQV